MIGNQNKILKRLASLKLAVFTILLLAVVSAVGTIVESRFDAERASVLVYRSPWMYLVLLLLSVNLIAVMVDRWPWKKRHLGFVLAHIGIIILLIGGVITQQFGIDGTMYFQIGTSSRQVTVSDKQLSVYSTFDGSHFTSLFHRDVNFLKYPAKENPLTIPIDDGALEIVDSLDYALVSEKVIESHGELDGSALRFQLYNSRVNQLEWLVQTRSGKTTVSEFGPLKMILGSTDIGEALGSNVLALAVEKNSPAEKKQNKTAKEDKAIVDQTSANQTSGDRASGDRASGDRATLRLHYAVYKKEGPKPIMKGSLKEGDELALPWMGFKFKVLRAYEKAHREWEVKPAERPSPLTTPAVLVRYKDRTQWAQLNDIARFFTPQSAYLVKYGQKQIDIGEELFLKKFSIGRYQGTRRAMAYESVVSVPEVGDVTISMNEPLHHKGFTFYQASFQEDPRTGEPVASILSVNKDPGRGLKYLGSLIMVLGIIQLFWFKRRQKKVAEAVTESGTGTGTGTVTGTGTGTRV